MQTMGEIGHPMQTWQNNTRLYIARERSANDELQAFELDLFKFRSATTTDHHQRFPDIKFNPSAITSQFQQSSCLRVSLICNANILQVQ